MDEHPMTDDRSSTTTNPTEKRLSDRIGPRSVAKLLAVTLDTKHDGEDPDRAIAELLDTCLASVWRPEEGRHGAWSKLVKQLLRKNDPGGQRTIGGLLLDSQAPLATIKLIRDRAKTRAARESGEAEHAVMTMIYFAAIAHALVYHRVKITTYSRESLASSFEKLIGKTWIPADFVALFRRAATMCREK